MQDLTLAFRSVVVVLDDDLLVHPRMVHADEQVFARRQDAGPDRGRSTGRNGVERTEEERRWKLRSEQNLIDRRDNAAPAELCAQSSP